MSTTSLEDSCTSLIGKKVIVMTPYAVISGILSEDKDIFKYIVDFESLDDQYCYLSFEFSDIRTIIEKTITLYKKY